MQLRKGKDPALMADFSSQGFQGRDNPEGLDLKYHRSESLEICNVMADVPGFWLRSDLIMAKFLRHSE